jgi:hypothetical protein
MKAASWLWFSLAAAQTAGDLGSVEGRIVNSVTGEPVVRAGVILAPASGGPDEFSTTTDLEGRFAFPTVPAGGYRIKAVRIGFMEAAAAPLRVEARQSVRDLAIKLSPLAVIAGKVLDENGDPLPGATVQLARYAYIQGRRRLSPARSVSTDDRGEYRLFHIWPGKYYLAAYGADPPHLTRGDMTQGYAVTYYPGARQASETAPIEIGAGQELRNIDFRLTLERLHSVVVRTTPAASRRTGSFVNFRPIDWEEHRNYGSRMTSRQDGSWEFERLQAGRYRVTARLSDEAKGALVASQVVEVPAAGEVLLTLRPAATVKGSVEIPQAAAPLQYPLGVVLDSDSAEWGQHNAEVLSDSTFAVVGVPPGRYRVRLLAPPNIYLKSVRQGAEDRPDFVVEVSGESVMLELAVGADTGSLAGTVAVPVGSTRTWALALLPVSPGGALKPLETRARPDGAFLFFNVPPGDYRLIALEDMEVGESQDPEFARKHERQGVRVTVRPSSREQIQEKLIPVSAERL